MGGTSTVPYVDDDSSMQSAAGTGTVPDDIAAPQPPTPAATTPPPAAAPAPDAGSNWAAAAQGPGTEQDSTQGQAPQPAPEVLTPNKPGGFLGVMQDVMDAMVGKSRPDLATDSQGNKYVKETTLSHGEQWVRLGGELLSGAAKGLAAGQGAGNMGKAAAAGVDQGEKIQQQRQQQEQNMTQEARQENIDHANRVMQNIQQTKLNWELTHDQHVASQDDVKFYNEEKDRYLKQGGEEVGTSTDPNDITHILKAQPDAVHDMVVKGTLIPIPAVDPDGKRNGTTWIKMPVDYAKQQLPPGQKFAVYNQLNHTLEYHNASDGMTVGQLQALNNAAGIAKQTYDQEAHKQTLEDRKQNSTETLQSAEANRANAEAGKARTETNKIKTEAEAAKNAPDTVAAKGEQVAHGLLGLEELDAKTRGAVETYLTQNHPELDQRSVSANAQERRTSDLANNALHNLNDIQAALTADPNLSGHINGLLSQGKTLVGTDDPRLTTINTALDNYALASTGAHGVRAVSAREDAKKALLNHLRNGPQGVRAGIAEARSSLTNLAQLGKPKRADGSPYTVQPKAAPSAGPVKPTPTKPTPPGATLMVPDKDGKKWYWVNDQKQNLGEVI